MSFIRLAFMAFALTALALALTACGGNKPPESPPPPQVGFVVVREQSAMLTTQLPGRIAASETSEVRPQVNGLILARLFAEGDQVRAGQPLYRIDGAPYVAQVASARAALARAQAAIASSRALQRRYGELVKINAIAKQDYDNAVTSAQQATADVAAQRAALRTAQLDLSRTTVRAPISGRIGRSLVTTGALVTAAQAEALATIQKLDPVFVDISQASADLLRLRQKMLAGQVSGGDTRVRLKLEDGSIYGPEGVLKFAEVTVDPATGSQTIRAVFPNPRGLLLPGMYATAELVEGTQARAMLVPQRAVTRDERGHPTVLVVGQGNKAEPRVLKTDRTVGDNWLVTSGLKVGDRVIVEGAMLLRPGMPVTPKPWDPNAKPQQGGPPPGGQPGGPPSGGQGQPKSEAK